MLSFFNKLCLLLCNLVCVLKKLLYSWLNFLLLLHRFLIFLNVRPWKPESQLDNVGRLSQSDQLYFVKNVVNKKKIIGGHWALSGSHSSIFVPDISVVQQLPSISPCSHLLPVTRHPRQIPHIIFMTLCPQTPTATCFRLLYLVGLQFICITGEPLHQVMRDHVAWATGERRVGRTSVLQLLPLANAIHCPALPKTGSGQ